MPSSWLADILQQPFSLTETGDLFFTGQAFSPLQQITRPLITALPNTGFLAVTGPEAAKFLQGQLTCDVLAVSPDQSSPGCHCTPKGRMIASFSLTQTTPERFDFALPRDVIPLLQQSLGKYMVFSKASLEDCTQRGVLFGLSGDDASAIIQQSFGAIPDTLYGQVNNTEGHCINIGGREPLYEVWLRREHAARFWKEARKKLAAADSQAWDLLNIRTGRTTINAQTSGLFLPQMLNFDTIGGVSFTKGCYTGQEVIARTHYRGAVKRRMQRFNSNMDECPADGTDVFSEGKNIGTIVASTQAEATLVEGLMVLQEGLETPLSLSRQGHGPKLTPLGPLDKIEPATD